MFYVKIRIDNISHSGLYNASEPSYDNMRLKKYLSFPEPSASTSFWPMQ